MNESLEGNEEHVIGTWRKKSLLIHWQKAQLNCVPVGWKAELICNEFGCLAEEISKPSVEDAAWFLLIAYVKCERKDTN